MTYLRAAHDPYLIAGTDVLRNLAGSSSAVKLAAVENDLCTARSIELHRNLSEGQGHACAVAVDSSPVVPGCV